MRKLGNVSDFTEEEMYYIDELCTSIRVSYIKRTYTSSLVEFLTGHRLIKHENVIVLRDRKSRYPIAEYFSVDDLKRRLLGDLRCLKY